MRTSRVSRLARPPGPSTRTSTDLPGQSKGSRRRLTQFTCSRPWTSSPPRQHPPGQSRVERAKDPPGPAGEGTAATRHRRHGKRQRCFLPEFITDYNQRFRWPQKPPRTPTATCSMTQSPFPLPPYPQKAQPQSHLPLPQASTRSKARATATASVAPPSPSVRASTAPSPSCAKARP